MRVVRLGQAAEIIDSWLGRVSRVVLIRVYATRHAFTKEEIDGDVEINANAQICVCLDVGAKRTLQCPSLMSSSLSLPLLI